MNIAILRITSTICQWMKVGKIGGWQWEGMSSEKNLQKLTSTEQQICEKWGNDDFHNALIKQHWHTKHTIVIHGTYTSWNYMNLLLKLHSDDIRGGAMSMTFVRVLERIPSWVAGRKCCRSRRPWCFPVMVAVELPGSSTRLYTLLQQVPKGKLYHNLNIFAILCDMTCEKSFQSQKKNKSSFWMGWEPPLLGWVDTQWGSLTESHVPNFSETWTWYLNHR